MEERHKAFLAEYRHQEWDAAERLILIAARLACLSSRPAIRYLPRVLICSGRRNCHLIGMALMQ